RRPHPDPPHLPRLGPQQGGRRPAGPPVPAGVLRPAAPAGAHPRRRPRRRRVLSLAARGAARPGVDPRRRAAVTPRLLPAPRSPATCPARHPRPRRRAPRLGYGPAVRAVPGRGHLSSPTADAAAPMVTTWETSL